MDNGVKTKQHDSLAEDIKPEIKTEHNGLIGKCDGFICLQCSENLFSLEFFVEHVSLFLNLTQSHTL